MSRPAGEVAVFCPDSEVGAHHLVHGDGVKVIAFEVDDAARAWEATTSRGAESVAPGEG